MAQDAHERVNEMTAARVSIRAVGQMTIEATSDAAGTRTVPRTGRRSDTRHQQDTWSIKDTIALYYIRFHFISSWINIQEQVAREKLFYKTMRSVDLRDIREKRWEEYTSDRERGR